nr:CRISPR-associated endoribonuclease Cas6 [uncultured Sellimonas sp.]
MIQLRLDFQLVNPELPREMDRLFVSFFKAALENYSEELFEELYDKKRSIIKPFTYSLLLPQARFTKEKIKLGQTFFAMFFSDADVGQLIHFFNAFKLMVNKTYPVQENSMQLIKIGTQKRQKITDSEIIVKMQSSLVVRRHHSETNHDEYFTYDHAEFGQVLKENVETFLEKLNIPVSMEGFSVTPIKGKKIVADIFGRKTDANIGIYKLTGSPELLNILYLSGIGSRRSEGHGKFEIIW